MNPIKLTMFYFCETTYKQESKETKRYKKRLLKIKKDLQKENINIIENTETFFSSRNIGNYLSSSKAETIEYHLAALTEEALRCHSNKLLQICYYFSKLEDHKSSLKYAYLSNLILPNEKSLNFFRLACLKLGEFNYFHNLTNSQLRHSTIFKSESMKLGKNYKLFSIEELKYNFIKSLNIRQIDFSFLSSIMLSYLTATANIPSTPKIFTHRPVSIFPSLTMPYNQISSQVRFITNEGKNADTIFIFFDSLEPNINRLCYLHNLQLVLILKLFFPSKVFIVGVGHQLNIEVWANYIYDNNILYFLYIANKVKMEGFSKLVYVNNIFCAFACDIRDGKLIKTHVEATKFVDFIGVQFYVYPWFERNDIFVGVSKPGLTKWLVENSQINLKFDYEKGFSVRTIRL